MGWKASMTKEKSIGDNESLNDLTIEKLRTSIIQEHKLVENSPTDFHPFLHLYGAMSQPLIINLVRGQCIPDDVLKLDIILKDWQKTTSKFREIEQKEAGIADNNFPIEIEQNNKLNEIMNDPLFKNTFSTSPIKIQMVDVDYLVAPQRSVSMEHVDRLLKIIPDDPTLENLIDICLSPQQVVPSIKTLQQTPNLVSFSSSSNDFRFLGGFVKENLTKDDMAYCLGGGQPVAAILLFIGYGVGSINILHANNRLILNNGFHRVYALKKKGITRIPAVVQEIGNPELEFPDNILGLNRSYLLSHPRPVLVKDFFEEEMTTIFKLKHVVRTVQMQWGTNQFNMAV